MKSFAMLPLVALALAAGCSSKTDPVAPSAQTSNPATASATAANLAGRPNPGKPGYEPAYVNGQTVTINAIEVPNVAPEKAQADFYEVVYPPNWQQLGLQPPQCNPCDHDNNGIDMLDYHDHVLDSMPASPAGNDYRAPWHVYGIVPALGNDADHNAMVEAAYAARLPVKSESEVDALLAARLDDGSLVAAEQDTHFYFLCAVVGQNAAK
jgi:hypothetical protein